MKKLRQARSPHPTSLKVDALQATPTKAKANAKAKTKTKHWRGSDLVAAAELATQATVNVTHIVEELHQSVLGTMGFKGKLSSQSSQKERTASQPPTRKASAGLTGLIYESIRTISAWVGGAVSLSYHVAQPLLAQRAAKRKARVGPTVPVDSVSEPASSPRREAVLAGLNGVLGDYLAKQNSPLATVMSLRFQGEALDLQATGVTRAALGSKILLVIHGLCMNDLQWASNERPSTKGSTNHAEALALRFGLSPVYLRYNTGLSIVENGLELSAQLDALLLVAPDTQALYVLSHSMGGLIIRSALHQAQLLSQKTPSQVCEKVQSDLQSDHSGQWPRLLKHVVFLGTPHHGAPLERAGRWIDLLLGSTPFSAPFKRLTQLRSAGITDLRYGHISDDHQAVPLPKHICFCTVAATMAGQRSLVADRLLGDGLAPLRSALGIHSSKARTLELPKENQRIFYKMNHMELLWRDEVLEQLMTWFDT